MRSLHRVSEDLDQLAFRIADRFSRYLGLIGSAGLLVPRWAFAGRPQGKHCKAYDSRMFERMKADEQRYNRPVTYRCGCAPHA